VFRLFLLLCITAGVLSAPTLVYAGTTAATGRAKTGWYFSGKGGPSYASLDDVQSTTSGETLANKDSANAVGAFGMAAGYEWMYKYHVPLRTELEFINRTEVIYDASPLSRSGSSGSIASSAQNVTTMVNAYWHFPVGSRTWWPYVSGGLGWAHTTMKSQYTPSGGGGGTKYRNTADNLAWSVGIGVSLKMGPDMTNDIELRHVDLGTVDWGLPSQNIKSDSFSANDLVFSLRYNF